MINLSISPQYRKEIDKLWFTNAATAALLYEGVNVENHDIAILVRNDDFLKKLKNKYFGINETTDVLSFPAGDEDPETLHIYLGDIIISLPQVKRQAESAAKTIQQEISLLVIHGTLHLLGYDHADEESEKIMWERQDAILNHL
jgi:probable rRNA maturation factor